MKILQSKMPQVSQYLSPKDDFKTQKFTPDEVIEVVDIVVNVCIGTSGMVGMAQALAKARRGDAVREILETLEAEASKQSKLHGAVTKAYVDKLQWSQLEEIRNRIDQLAGNDPQRRQQVIDILSEYLDDLNVDKIIDEGDFEKFADIMEQAETEIENLNI